MKSIKKILSLVLALAMIFAMASTAFAATGTSPDSKGSITVNNTVKDNAYSIYRIFDLESFDTDKNAYSYKVNTAWSAFFAEGAEGLNYVTIDAKGYVTWIKGANAADFAAKAIAFANKEDAKIAATATQTSTANGSDLVFDNLDLGYYLVQSNLGALCALTTTSPAATVNEKNAKPTLDKTVKEGDDWYKNNDATIGDTVEFKATITVQGTAKDYVMHDKMDDGLTYQSVSKVTLNGNDVTADGNYIVTAPGTDGCTFDVTFTEAFCNGLNSGDVIVVYYSATLNENAAVEAAENNNAYLSYKDESSSTESSKTEESNTKTYTWEIPVFKYYTTTETVNGVAQAKETPLAGAVFSIYKDEACTAANIVKFTKTSDNVYQYKADGTVTEITTDSNGKFNLQGLDAGTYYLKEIEAPAGFNQLDTVLKVVISHEGLTTSTDNDDLTYKLQTGVKNGDTYTMTDVTEVKVENKTGAVLPTTGGIGTTMFYVVGSALVIAAVVLLVTKKRMSARG